MKLLGLDVVAPPGDHRARWARVERLGAEVFLLHGRDPAGAPAGRHHRVVGSKHLDRIVGAASAWHATERFDGVLTFSESSVVAAAAVADALGLPGVGLDVAVTSRNKYLMRLAHERAGVPHPRFRLVRDVGAALAAGRDLGYPVVLKPTLGGGSTYVFRVDGPAEMDDRFPHALRGIEQMPAFEAEAEGVDLGPHGLMVESFLDGREYLVEAVVWDGEAHLGSVVDRVTVEGDTFDDDIHHGPTSLGDTNLAAVRRLVEAGAAAQRVRRSVVHAAVRFHRGTAHLLGIAVRPGANGLDHVARLTAGWCPIRAAVDVVRGVRPPAGAYHPTGVHTASMCLLCEPGRIEAVEVPPAVTASDRVLFLEITARPGDVVLRPPAGNTVVGVLGTTGTSFADAMAAAAELAGMIEVRVVPEDPAGGVDRGRGRGRVVGGRDVPVGAVPSRR